MSVTKKFVLTCMRSLLRIPDSIQSSGTINRIIIAEFGFDENVVTITWNLLDENNFIPAKSNVKHLLWFLAYSKTYGPLEVYCSRFGTCKVTLTKHINEMSRSVTALKAKIASRKKIYKYFMFNFLIKTNFLFFR